MHEERKRCTKKGKAVSPRLGLVRARRGVCLGPILPQAGRGWQLFAIRLTGAGTEHRTLPRASKPGGPALGLRAGLREQSGGRWLWLVRGVATDQCLISQHRHRTKARLSSSLGLVQNSSRHVYPHSLYYPCTIKVSGRCLTQPCPLTIAYGKEKRMTTYVVRPSATFCAKAETYLVEEAAFDAAREWTEEHGSPCRINVEQELPGY